MYTIIYVIKSSTLYINTGNLRLKSIYSTGTKGTKTNNTGKHMLTNTGLHDNAYKMLLLVDSVWSNNFVTNFINLLCIKNCKVTDWLTQKFVLLRVRPLSSDIFCLICFSEAQVRFVKCVVLSHGYRRREFYQLPSDGSEGSRELLLVFSWLMCRIGLVEQLLTLSRVKPWDETIICMVSKFFTNILCF